MKLLLMLNPAAGGGRPLAELPKIRDWIAATPHDIEVLESKSPDHLRSEILASGKRGIEAVILAGGDGTVHEALPALLRSALPFGVLPMGRGNDFVRNIAAPGRPAPAGGILRFTGTRLIDVPTVNDIPFASIACFGFDALVNALASNHEGYVGGTAGYVICVLKALSRFTPFEAEVTVDDRPWRGAVTMIAVANGPYYGGGMKIAPSASMDDGQLTVCVVGALPPARLLWQFPKVFTGRHISHPAVSIMHGRTIRVSASSRQVIFADGEQCGTLPAVCAVGTRQIRVLC